MKFSPLHDEVGTEYKCKLHCLEQHTASLDSQPQQGSSNPNRQVGRMFGVCLHSISDLLTEHQIMSQTTANSRLYQLADY